MLRVRIRAEPGASAALILPVTRGQVPALWAAHAAAECFAGEAETVCDILDGRHHVILVGLGEDAEAAGACATASLLRSPHITIDARGLPPATAARLAAGACLRAWHFSSLRTRDDDDSVRVADLDLIADDLSTTEQEWAQLAAGVEAALFARDLVTEPANTLTPAGFVTRLDRLVRAGITLDVLDQAELARQEFGGLLAVGQGSVHPPCLAVLRWPGTQAGAPVAFVGKGITFDTGGISIKPADGMWEMRADMAGAAACAGALFALALRRSPAPAIAVLALAENATGAASYRPGDVLRMLDGSTVQVVDTDAEGRLVLADALAYAGRQNPAAIVDLATLTGSIVVALGHARAGLFDTNISLAEAVAKAGEAMGELVWRMPLAENDRRALDSEIADIKHCVDGTGHPDACQAAAFLREFVGATPWVHLDIAGMESQAETSPRHAKGATGFGTRLLDRLVAQKFEHHG